MTRRASVLLLLTLVPGAALHPARVQAQTSVSVSARIGDFHVAAANYYRVPEREVVILRERHIRDDEMPVALFIAQRASVSPSTIADLRLRGDSWWDISVRYGIGPDVYYVPVAVTPGPPYGKAYGHYKRPRSRWNTIVLADDDIVNLVHLRFLSDYHHVAPERVIDLRAHQGDVLAIHADLSRRTPEAARADAEGAKGNGRGRGVRRRK